MAITRAQQYKQMLQKGGRIGLQGGGADMGKVSGKGPGGTIGGGVGPEMGGGDNAREAAISRGYQAIDNFAARQAAENEARRIKNREFAQERSGLDKFLDYAPFVGGIRRAMNFLNLDSKPQFAGLQNFKDEKDPKLFYTYRMPGAPSITKDVNEEEETAPVDLGLRYRYMADGGMIGDQIRQAYGLGSIVKKATRAVKKVAKSPVGKAAITAAGIYYAGGGNLPGASFFGKGSLNPFKTLAANVPGMEQLGMSLQPSKFASIFSSIPGGGVTAAITAASLLPLLGIGTGDESEEEAQQILKTQGIDINKIRSDPYAAMGKAYRFYAEGGDVEPVAKKTMPLLDMDGMEKDYRAEGGFVPIGRMEKADDVPARLSKNEFVFTADAVRNAGDGDVDKGAEVMYNMMKNLEAGGEVSEESQGLEGAREMFQTSKRLEEVL